MVRRFRHSYDVVHEYPFTLPVGFNGHPITRKKGSLIWLIAMWGELEGSGERGAWVVYEAPLPVAMPRDFKTMERLHVQLSIGLAPTRRR